MLKLFLTSTVLLISTFSYAFETKAKHAILIDYDTKAVLFEKEAHAHMPPSSMSKMMTAYVAFEYLKNGHVKLDEVFSISEKAWGMGGTRMFIPLNAKVSFEDLLKGLIVHSGNDAAVAIAENLAGSEEEFANKMNETAQRIGMKESNFVNATGWPAENNYSSAHDLAILASHIIKDFPEYYHYFSMTEFTYNKIKQGNKNGLLYRSIGADGLKTGHADEAGYGLTASAKKGKRRLIAVTNGLKTNKERTNETEALINYGMMNFFNIEVLEKGHVVDKVKVVHGQKEEVGLVSNHDLMMTIPRHEYKSLKTRVHYHEPVMAPIKAGTVLGEIIAETSSGSTSFPLVADQDVELGNFFQRVNGNLRNIFK